MISFIRRKIAKYKLMNTKQEFGYELDSYELDGYGTIEYAKWMNPFAYSMVVSTSQLAFFKQFISEGDFVIDIGANIGDTGLPMGLSAGKSGTVLALEPNPHLYKILKVNSGLNTDKLNIVPLNFAATEEDGEFYYNSSEATFNNGGISKVKSKFHGKFELEEKIVGVNLERLLRKEYAELLKSLTCIKVDTEGYDKDILLSLSGIINEFKPIVMFEVFKRLTKDERFQLYDLFSENGYELFMFDDFDVEAATYKVSRDDMDKWRHFEVYATYTKN
jgi:FkbM family methyltransferase